MSAPQRPTRSWLTGVAVAVGLVGCASVPATSPHVAQRPTMARDCTAVPRGSVTAHHLRSVATKQTERFQIYRPPGTTRGDPLRLLVLLHGATADDTQWLDVGIASAADCMAERGESDQTLIVLVDGSSVERDHTGSPAPMEQLVIDEILPEVHHLYPNLQGRSGTAIGGISLGGRWALQIAAHHPDLFEAAGGHSPTISLSATELESLVDSDVRIWLDAGQSDGLQRGIRTAYDRVQAAGGGAMVMQWSGQHDRHYWSQHTEDYLRFYNQTW